MAPPLKVAVLDDYQELSKPYYETLDSASYEVYYFKDTLRPYNHPQTTQEEKDKLAKRLEPFHIICKTTAPPHCLPDPMLIAII
jgi:hypothetical protein